MGKDILENVPEDILQYIKHGYEDYKATVTKPINFETYFFKVYDLTINIVGLKNQIGIIEEEIVEFEEEFKEVNLRLASAETEDMLEDFNIFYDVVINDTSLNQEDKLTKLKAYYLTTVRNITKEFKFLNNLNSMIKEQDSEGYTDILLTDFYSYVKQFYI